MGLCLLMLLPSCATLKKAGDGSLAALRKSAGSAVSGVAALPDRISGMMPGRSIKVVEVREEELEELKSGSELAKEHRRKQLRSNFWLFRGPVDFREPALPEPGAEADGSLLPPLLH
jgi:hypothetical protein